MRSILVAGGLAVAIASAFGASAHAQLVQNGGFEADNTFGNTVVITSPTDWAVGGGGNAGVDSTDPNSGSNDAFLSNDFQTGAIPSSLTQTITGLVVGQEYIVDFFLAADGTTIGDPSTTFDAMLGDQDLLGGGISGSSLSTLYTEFPVTLTADAISADLVFTGNSANGVFFLDDVSINAVAVPEPMTALVFVSALGAFTLVRRRRA